MLTIKHLGNEYQHIWNLKALRKRVVYESAVEACHSTLLARVSLQQKCQIPGNYPDVAHLELMKVCDVEVRHLWSSREVCSKWQNGKS